MADEVSAAAPVSASPVAEVAAPVAAVVSSEASVVAAPEAAVVTSPVEGAAPVAEKSPETVVEAKPLLSPETPEVKTDAVVEAPKVEVEALALPTYEFKIPEGGNADHPLFKKFQTTLGEFQNLSKVDQAAAQKLGQDFLDLHQEEQKNFVEAKNRADWDWFKSRNKEWLENAKKDPQIGGEKFDSTVSSASQAISLYGGTKAEQLETAKLFQETGVENHPALLRFLANITKIAAKEGTPVAGSVAPMKPSGSIADRMYGGKGAA
jgi:hypothetical protein